MSPEGGSAKVHAGNRLLEAPFVLYACVMTVFGTSNCVMGPLLPELERQAGIDALGSGVAFLCRGLASMAGGLVAGALLDVLRDPHVVMSAFLLFRALVEITIPWGRGLTALSAQLAAIAFCGNATATVTMCLIGWTYGEDMGRQMNIAESVFGVGAAVAPGLALLCHHLAARGVYAYWVIAAADVAMIAAALLTPAARNPQAGDSSESASSLAEDKALRRVDWPSVALCSLAVMLAASTEVALIFWMYSYATEEIGLSPNAAGLVNTAFFVAFTATRFLCGWLVTIVSAATILKASLAIALVSSFGLVSRDFGAFAQSASMIGIGMGLAPYAANATTVLGQKSFLSGRVQGVMRIQCAFGAMLGASATGFLQKLPEVGGSALPLVVLSGLAAETLVTVGMLSR